MEGYYNLEQIAKIWNISVRRARLLCAENRIDGAIKYKNTWYIPADAEKPLDQRVTSGKYIKTTRELKRGKRTILIADDDCINRTMLAETLGKAFDIKEAADGEETIKLILENKDDLSIVLLDLLMPKYDGIQVLEVMQRNGLINKIPIIMITSESTENAAISAYQNGVADIIYKPFSSKIVLQRTLNIIELYEHRYFLEKELETSKQEFIERITELENEIAELKELNKALPCNNTACVK